MDVATRGTDETEAEPGVLPAENGRARRSDDDGRGPARQTFRSNDFKVITDGDGISIPPGAQGAGTWYLGALDETPAFQVARNAFKK